MPGMRWKSRRESCCVAAVSCVEMVMVINSLCGHTLDESESAQLRQRIVGQRACRVALGLRRVVGIHAIPIEGRLPAAVPSLLRDEEVKVRLRGVGKIGGAERIGRGDVP